MFGEINSSKNQFALVRKDLQLPKISYGTDAPESLVCESQSQQILGIIVQQLAVSTSRRIVFVEVNYCQLMHRKGYLENNTRCSLDRDCFQLSADQFNRSPFIHHSGCVSEQLVYSASNQQGSPSKLSLENLRSIEDRLCFYSLDRGKRPQSSLQVKGRRRLQRELELCFVDE